MTSQEVVELAVVPGRWHLFLSSDVFRRRHMWGSEPRFWRYTNAARFTVEDHHVKRELIAHVQNTISRPTRSCMCSTSSEFAARHTGRRPRHRASDLTKPALNQSVRINQPRRRFAPHLLTTTQALVYHMLDRLPHDDSPSLSSLRATSTVHSLAGPSGGDTPCR